MEQGFANRGLAWQSSSWWAAKFDFVELQKTYRQVDNTFVSILHRMRTAENTAEDLRLLNSQCRRELQPCNGVEPISLYVKNIQADERNELEMSKLRAAAFEFKAKDTVQVPIADIVLLDFVAVLRCGHFMCSILLL